jgi:hypothetical protein
MRLHCVNATFFSRRRPARLRSAGASAARAALSISFSREPSGHAPPSVTGASSIWSGSDNAQLRDIWGLSTFPGPGSFTLPRQRES